jgi:arginine-tRNA-protein transferase
MSDMDFTRYEMMAEDTASATNIMEYRNPQGELIACVLIDYLSDGLSMVYSFFDPDLKSRGLGNFMILDQVRRCKTDNMPFLYLGYWVNGSPKMHYKSRFTPYELLGVNGWQSPKEYL